MANKVTQKGLKTSVTTPVVLVRKLLSNNADCLKIKLL